MVKNIRRLRARIEALRRVGGVRPVELERLAKSLGRTTEKRGKHPTWVSRFLPSAPPVSIPSHPGSLNRFTAKTILDQLEADLDLLEARSEGG